MLRRRTLDEQPTSRPTDNSVEPVSAPKFPRPKILAIDVPDIADDLSGAGYAVAQGTYGTPLVVPREAGYCAPKFQSELPNHTEQEIVIVDLVGPDAREATDADFAPPAWGLKAIWAPTERGLVDPRLPMMHFVKEAFDRIYDHGGVFIVFADARTSDDFVYTDRGQGYDSYGSETIRASNWDVVKTLNELQVGPDHGQEIELADNGYAEQLGLGSYLRNASFSCVVHPPSWWSGRWTTLATSKYGEPVSGIITPDEEDGSGWVFVLPRVRQRPDVVRELLDHVLPSLVPALFPHVERDLWTRRPEYELPEITVIKEEIESAEQAARARVRELEEHIEREREQSAFLHELLTATGDDLVQAVITALKAIGFEDVHDVDAAQKATGNTGPMREDIHVLDAAVPVLIEVKGIGGLPKEASSLQVAKYLTPRMREWRRTDLRGLAIVNHQKSLPALDREHEHVFQPDVLVNAEAQGFGLLTTWDLHRLVRSFRALGWRHEDVAELFTTPGRVHPVPAHYAYVGHVDGFWEQARALGLRMEEGEIAVGDRVAYELPVEFVEEEIASLRLNDQDVASASAPAHVGLATLLTKQQARKGVRAYRVRSKA